MNLIQLFFGDRPQYKYMKRNNEHHISSLVYKHRSFEFDLLQLNIYERFLTAKECEAIDALKAEGVIQVSRDIYKPKNMYIVILDDQDLNKVRSVLLPAFTKKLCTTAYQRRFFP